MKHNTISHITLNTPNSFMAKTLKKYLEEIEINDKLSNTD